ncbi:MAG: hypothetical protein RR619_09645, partial [Raoultibacter sp.]
MGYGYRFLTAMITMLKADDELTALDQAGLLIDFSQDEYWRTRNAPWIEPNGAFSTDGQMIAIPFEQFV